MNPEVGQARMGPHFLQCTCTGSAAAVVLHPLFVFAVQEGRERSARVCGIKDWKLLAASVRAVMLARAVRPPAALGLWGTCGLWSRPGRALGHVA